MAPHIQGPLYYEQLGRTGTPLVFLHPNPMDQSCWMYQMAHFSTWFRCIAIDVPGYGRSPKSEDGLTMEDLAEAFWEAVDEVESNDEVILVGCSVGSSIAPYMYAQRPDRTAAIVLTGAGVTVDAQAVASRRIPQYQAEGINFRYRYVFDVLSSAFRATPHAAYFADLFTERNDVADVESIIRQFVALGNKDPNVVLGVKCPVLIVSGTEDAVHERALLLKQKLPQAELGIIPGAGHACQLEQPWRYDSYLKSFLERNDLFPKP